MEAVYTGCIPEDGWKVKLQLSLCCQPKFSLRIHRHGLPQSQSLDFVGKLWQTIRAIPILVKTSSQRNLPKNGNNPTTISTCWYLELCLQGKDIPWHCIQQLCHHGGNKHPTCMLQKKTQDLDPSFPVSNSNCTGAFFFVLNGFCWSSFHATLPTQKGALHEVQIRPDSYQIRTFFGYLFDTVLFTMTSWLQLCLACKPVKNEM